MTHEYLGAIDQIIKELNHHDSITSELVSEIIESSLLKMNDLLQYTRFDHPPYESYGRQLIYDNGNFKILLMSWKSGDFTAIHNHGNTEWGCVYFFGEAAHRIYSVDNNELKIIEKTDFLEGRIAPVCGDLTHIMGNSGSKDFATLHIYGSNVRKRDVSKDAVVYLPELDKIVTTMGSAYLNMDKELILSEKSMIKVSDDMASDYFFLVKPFFERNGLFSLLHNLEKKFRG